MKIENAKVTDLSALMRIERAGFTPAEAADEASMAQRIEVINDTFLVARGDHDEVLGFIVGPVVSQRYLTDDLFEQVEIDGIQIHAEGSCGGLGSKLLKQLIENAKSAQRVGVTLTCLSRLVPFYELNGFTDEGLSDSTHGGETWHNMVLDLSE